MSFDSEGNVTARGVVADDDPDQLVIELANDLRPSGKNAVKCIQKS